MQSDEYLDGHYIGIRKESETDSSCTYRFIANRYRRIGNRRLEDLGPVFGSFRIDKGSGSTELIEPMPGDDKGGTYVRAAQKISRYWREGELPDSAIYCAG